MNVNVRKMQLRARRGADYNCKHRLLVSAACTLSSILSPQKFLHFNQNAACLSVSPVPFGCVVISTSICSSSSDGKSFGPLETQSAPDSLVGFIFRGIRNAKPIAQGRVCPRNENECFWLNVRVRVCRLCVVRVARSENGKQLEGNLIIKHRVCARAVCQVVPFS